MQTRYSTDEDKFETWEEVIKYKTDVNEFEAGVEVIKYEKMKRKRMN